MIGLFSVLSNKKDPETEIGADHFNGFGFMTFPDLNPNDTITILGD